MSRPAVRSAAAALALLVLAPGCATRARLDVAQLPDAPLALVYWSESEALEREDALRDRAKRGQRAREGVVRLETLDAIYGGTSEVPQRIAELDGRLALLDPRSTAVTPVAQAPTQARPLGWSPDHRRLLLQGSWRGQRQLFVWSRDTGEVEIATPDPLEHPMGCLGPDGLLVAAELSFAGTRATVRLLRRTEGGAFEPLTDGPWDVQPACSPTGRHVAYATLGPDGVMHVATLDLEAGGPPQRIGRGQEPAFSGDGEWVVFAGPTARGPRLYRARVGGGGKTSLGDPGSDTQRDPTVSPDGRFVAFVVEEGTRQRLWVTRWDGSGRRPLLLQGDAAAPVW